MPIHFIALLKRKPDVSREQFQKYWGENHARIFTGLKAVRENIVRYNQFHLLSDAADTLSAAGANVAPYDGVAEFWVDKLEDMFALFGDEEYQAIAVPDEDNFLDREAVEVMVGEDQVKFQQE